MPIENERKYVLRPPFDELELEVSNAASQILQIEQAYLVREKHTSVRVRGVIALQTENAQEVLAPWHEFNMKRNVDGECIEIETLIDKVDFLKLWSVSSGKLRKIRYVVEGWEIDFFKDFRDDTYFVQAEIELDPGVDKPDLLLPLVESNLLYRVKKGDNRFSSKKLSDVRYTNKVLKALLLERGRV